MMDKLPEEGEEDDATQIGKRGSSVASPIPKLYIPGGQNARP